MEIMNDTYPGLKLANIKGEKVGLVFSKLKGSSKLQLLLCKRLELTDALYSPILWEF